jgi:hypothetical protein
VHCALNMIHRYYDNFVCELNQSVVRVHCVVAGAGSRTSVECGSVPADRKQRDIRNVHDCQHLGVAVLSTIDTRDVSSDRRSNNCLLRVPNVARPQKLPKNDILKRNVLYGACTINVIK